MSEDRLKARPRMPLNWQMNKPWPSNSERRSAKQAAYENRNAAPVAPRQFTRTPSRKPITLHKGPVP
jgi:hypothetical protein